MILSLFDSGFDMARASKEFTRAQAT